MIRKGSNMELSKWNCHSKQQTQMELKSCSVDYWCSPICSMVHLQSTKVTMYTIYIAYHQWIDEGSANTLYTFDGVWIVANLYFKNTFLDSPRCSASKNKLASPAFQVPIMRRIWAVIPRLLHQGMICQYTVGAENDTEESLWNKIPGRMPLHDISETFHAAQPKLETSQIGQTANSLTICQHLANQDQDVSELQLQPATRKKLWVSNQ